MIREFVSIASLNLKYGDYNHGYKSSATFITTFRYCFQKRYFGEAFASSQTGVSNPT